VDPATLSDPRNNILFGARYLAGRGRQAGVTDWNDPAQQDRALAAYNGGGDPNYVRNVRQWMASPGGQAPAGGQPAAPAGGQPASAPAPGAGTPYEGLPVVGNTGLTREQLRIAQAREAHTPGAGLQYWGEQQSRNLAEARQRRENTQREQEQTQTRATAEEQRRFTGESSLRGELAQSRPVQTYDTLANVYQRMRLATAVPGSVSDYALVIDFMKSGDPGTGVMTSEQQSAAAMTGLPDWLIGEIRTAASGGEQGRLSDRGRTEMQRIVEQRMVSAWDNARPHIDRAERNARDNRLRPDQVTSAYLDPDALRAQTQRRIDEQRQRMNPTPAPGAAAPVAPAPATATPAPAAAAPTPTAAVTPVRPANTPAEREQLLGEIRAMQPDQRARAVRQINLRTAHRIRLDEVQ
jgi:hypothetical protein